MEDWQSKLIEIGREYGVFVGIGLVGVGLVISGLWGVVGGGESKVEIISDQQSVISDQENCKLNPANCKLIMVDVAGAVEKPGVYELEKNSRIGEAITMAGGLSAEADREWVTRFLNLAGEVEDGGKVYIPSQSEGIVISGQDAVGSGGEVAGAASSQGGLININTASASQLDSLWGIGSSRADSIITNRPYGSVEELESKAGIPSNVYERIKDQVSVY